jgi:hypothetical protein
MTTKWIIAIGTTLLLSASAQAGTGLLSEMTAGKSTAAPLTVAQLSEVRGEGTIEKFISLPNLQRSFERSVSLDNGLSVSIVAVAGEGIRLRISNPNIP